MGGCFRPQRANKLVSGVAGGLVASHCVPSTEAWCTSGLHLPAQPYATASMTDRASASSPHRVRYSKRSDAPATLATATSVATVCGIFGIARSSRQRRDMRRCTMYGRGKGFGAAVPAEPVEPVEVVPLALGVYAAKTKIRTRSKADVKSKPTGDTIKKGECFEVTEVRAPSTEDANGYLKVGKRGWVFDRGISGDFTGQPIVDRIADEEQETYMEVFRDPDNYKQYREIMSGDDYVERLRGEMQKSLIEEGGQEGLVDLEQNMEELVTDPANKEKLAEWDAWMDDPSSSPELQKKYEALQDNWALGEEGEELKAMTQMADQTGNPEKPKKYPSLQDKLDELVNTDPEFADLKQARDDSNELSQGVTAPVMPKWVKLSGQPQTDEEKKTEKEWEEKKKRILAPPGGDRALRMKPRAWGRRMGIRVPVVCSPL